MVTGALGAQYFQELSPAVRKMHEGVERGEQVPAWGKRIADKASNRRRDAATCFG
jgi:hypothetical protein